MILMPEDNPADAELVNFELEESGHKFTAKVDQGRHYEDPVGQAGAFPNKFEVNKILYKSRGIL